MCRVLVETQIYVTNSTCVSNLLDCLSFQRVYNVKVCIVLAFRRWRGCVWSIGYHYFRFISSSSSYTGVIFYVSVWMRFPHLFELLGLCFSSLDFDFYPPHDAFFGWILSWLKVFFSLIRSYFIYLIRCKIFTSTILIFFLNKMRMLADSRATHEYFFSWSARLQNWWW